MENFIVSARKYRPQTFDTVVGQSVITGTLKNAIRHNQLAQAFLFCGPRGVGKTTCARILAKTINCSDITPEGEACDHCQSCISFNENSSFNIYELDGASNNSVEDIRTLVEQVRIPPQMGIYKVYIIDEVHMLSSSAFNAFLKTLEEPPAYAKFILATTEKHKIIPTILSRCQIFDFKRITADDMVGHLKFVAGKESIRAEEDALHVIASKADGAMRDALSIFDQLVSFAGNELTYATVIENLNVLDYEYYFMVTERINASDTAGLLLILDDILGKGFDGQHFLTGFAEHLRNLLVCKDTATLKLLETAPSVRDRYASQSAGTLAPRLLELLDIANRCDLSYKVSSNKRLHLEIAMLQMCSQAGPAGTQAQAAPAIAKAQAPSVKTASVQPPVKMPESATRTDELPEKPIPQSAVTQQPQPAEPPPKAAPPSNSPAPVKLKDLKHNPVGTVSIKQTVKPVPGASEALEDPALYDKATPFGREELLQAWNEGVSRIKNDMPHLYNSLVQCVPGIKEDFTVEIVLENKLLDDELFKKKGELLNFLRAKLDNYRISLVTRVDENVREARPYTDKEKFGKLAEANPSLLKLKEELDLEIEY
jgi:DNA polymerase-3 subunit gamma/tau